MSELTPAGAGLITNPQIRCAHTQLVNPKELKPHPNNPNKHPAKQIDMFISILGFQGWRRPITVSTLSGFVTKGHGALEAALAAGYTAVPVDFQEYGNEQEELADIVADNQLQRMSEMDTGKLTELLVNLDTGSFNMEMTGLPVMQIEKILAPMRPPQLNFSGEDNSAAPAGGGLSLVGAPGEQGQPYAAQPGNDSDSPYAGSDNRVASSQVRMIQLFFTETTIAEFMELADHFMKVHNIDNVTDTVLEVLRHAYRQQSSAQPAE